MTEDSQLINIRPTTAVYKTFERYNYTQSTAYAEFIDNSTQSYFNHRVELEQDENFDYCLVDIHHDSVKNIIVITDNCFGMERKDFERAIGTSLEWVLKLPLHGSAGNGRSSVR